MPQVRKLCIDKTECVLGETITFTMVEEDEPCPTGTTSSMESLPTDIYENDVIIGFINVGTPFYYTPNTIGVHTLLFADDGDIVSITVTEPIPATTGSWSIGDKTVSSLTINNKEIQSIVRVSDGVTIYQKPSTPVVTVGSVELTGDKSVLSFKHDEECVLTATVYDDSSTPIPLEDKVVNFKIGSNVIGSAVTDSNGEATYTYKSRGANNITITAQCETESDTFSIEDNWVYLTGATDYSPNWLVHNTSTVATNYLLTTENDKYKLVKYGTDRTEVGLELHPVMDFGLKSFEITASFYWTADNSGSYNNIFDITDKTGWTNSFQIGTWSSSKILGYIVNNTNKRSNPSGRLSTGTWYIFKAKYDPANSIIYTAIIDKSSGNIVAETNGTDIFPVVPHMLRWRINYSASTNYLDEVKVKSLTTQTDYYNIDVTGDSEILSAYDNDIMTITVTVTDVDGEPVTNQSVELFYQGETHATSTTNSNGVATFTYTATGFGYASVYAYVGTSVGKYDFIDAKYYGSNSDVFGFACSYPVQNWDRIHFRFHSLPTHTIIGIGNASTSDYVLEKNGDTYKYHRNPSSVSKTGTPSSAHAFEVGKDYIFIKNNKTSPSRTEIFKNNTYVDWWTSGNSANRIRVDKYANDDFDIEVFVL